RAGHAEPGLHGGRGARAARRVAAAAAAVRGAAADPRAHAAPPAEPPRPGGRPAVSDLDLLTHRVRAAAAEPEGALVLLQGRGADETDLSPLLDALDPQRRLVGVTPRAPLSLPPGGAHWYVVREVGYPDPGTFLPTYERLGRWFDALPEALGVPRARTVL